MNDSAAIDTNNISKFFGNFRALNGVSVCVRQGEIFGFIGRNGAGKTTFMRILCGLMKPSSGTLKVQKKVSFLPQNVRFRDNMNAGEALRFFAGLRGCDAAADIEFAEESQIDLSSKINTLSPGQQRKLQLVIATIGSPDLLVLDEPMAGLDPSGVQQVRRIIKVLNKRGCTVFISSHVLMELENLCDTIAVIEKGEVRYQGACSTVYEIETEGMEESILKSLQESQNKKFDMKDGILLAGVERQEVPSVLQLLYQKNVRVFSVKRQGIETLYNSLTNEG